MMASLRWHIASCLVLLIDASSSVNLFEASSRRTAACSSTSPQSVTELLNQLTPSTYDPIARPNITGPATPVQVQVELTSITKVDDKQFSFGVSGYLRTMWADPRLAYTPKTGGGCFDQFNIPAANWKRVWQPDLYFDNALSQSWGSSSLQVLPTGYVIKSQRFEHMFECNDMYLGKMPFDRQRCKIVIGSYSEDSNSVYTTPYQGTNGVIKPECYTGPVDWRIDSLSSSVDSSMRGTAANMQPWTMVNLEFVFKRLYMYYLRGYVLVAFLFTMASWSGFFINAKAAPARVAIGVIPLLTMITLSNGVYAKLPTIPYTTWLNGYIFICLFFCTLSVFEFGLVSFCLNLEERNLKRFEVLKTLSFLKKLNSASTAATAFKAMRTSNSLLQSSLDLTKQLSVRSVQPEADQVVPIAPAEETTDGLLAEMSKLQSEMIQSAFSMFSWDDAESISAKEARRSMRNFGQFYTLGQVKDMFTKLGIKQGHQMQKVDFIKLLRSYDTIAPPNVITKTFWDMPWSYQVDFTMRIAYIVTFLLTSIVWVGFIYVYNDGVTLEGKCMK